MANSLYPAFVRINYHSEFAPHTMTIPTTEYTLPSVANPSGTFEAWDSSVRDADDMITELVEELENWYPTSVEFDDYIIFTMSSPTADANPQYSAQLTQAGLQVTPGWYKAAERILTFRTTEFGIFKLNMLDSGTGNAWDKVTNPALSASLPPLIAVLVDDSNGWSGRDNARPNQFIQMSLNLNEKLRRAYRMQ